MKRKDVSVTIALCVSLLVHGGLMFALVEKEIADLTAGLYHPPFDQEAWARNHPRAPDRQAEDRHEVAKLPEPKPEIPEFEELFGERKSKGAGMNSSPGERPLQAQEGSQYQAALTRNPGETVGGRGGASDSSPTKEKGAGGASGAGAMAMAQMERETAAAAATPFGVPLTPIPQEMGSGQRKTLSPQVIGVGMKDPALPATEKTTAKALTKNDAPATRPTGIAVATAMPRMKPVAVAAAVSQPQQARAASASGASAGAPRGAAGEIGHKSESESDPFSDKPMIVWSDGKVEARDGRKVKSVRPKLTTSGLVALREMEKPVIVLAVHIDETGTVTAVDYVQKSNIAEVDLPHYRAAFDWWIEPSKDKNGNPISDILLIPFVWH